MYQSPIHYDATKQLSSDEVRSTKGQALAIAYNEALKEVTEAANKGEDYLDPNSIRVRITVTGRAL